MECSFSNCKFSLFRYYFTRKTAQRLFLQCIYAILQDGLMSVYDIKHVLPDHIRSQL